MTEKTPERSYNQGIGIDGGSETVLFQPVTGMIGDTGIYYEFVTSDILFVPSHWHGTMEIVYLLNGNWDVVINGIHYSLTRRKVIVINPEDVHSIRSEKSLSMYLVIRLDLEKLEKYMTGFVKYPIFCIPSEIPDEPYDDYLKICFLMEELTELFIENPDALDMEVQGIILQIYARLLRHFSAKVVFQIEEHDKGTMNRMHEVINYISEHYRETVTLEDAAGHVGLGREYFCRFFKKNTGSTFMNYLNEMRIARIFDELLHTDKPVGEIAEENGFTNMKLFHRMFRSMYGGTPSEIRKQMNQRQSDLKGGKNEG